MSNNIINIKPITQVVDDIIDEIMDDIDDNMILGNMLLMHDTKVTKVPFMQSTCVCKACTK